ncbi:C2 family cysteine protease [Anatilimnocola floriformis]|uniref:C2 family cysteine protease n=1 Tax=Anatilimnocola floriformis TaxID=2948575 RepID=UPI0020C369C4|nr:C2 family cysteine protease [Anatilimnocola floriformis]
MKIHLAAVLALLGCLFVSATLEAATADEFLQQIEQNFAGWDRDSDGVLSAGEIDLAADDAKVTGKAAAALAALKRVSRSPKYNDPTLNKEKITEFAKGKPAADKPDIAGMYAQGVSRLEKLTSRELFVGGEPRLDTLHQGRLGNCFCLAPLGSVLSHDPKDVVAMFKKLDDGKIRVTLGKNTVIITPPTDTELARTATNEDQGIWVNVYEKALGSLRNDAKAEADRAGSSIDALARGGSAGTILAYITGNEIVRHSCKFAKDDKLSAEEKEAKLKEFREALVVATKAKRRMTTGTDKATMPGITGNHAYALLGYDSETDRVKVWNPFGNTFTPKGEPNSEHGYPRVEGISQIPLKDFVAQFSGIAIEVVPQSP